jgi:hypothetical protein
MSELSLPLKLSHLEKHSYRIEKYICALKKKQTMAKLSWTT